MAKRVLTAGFVETAEDLNEMASRISYGGALDKALKAGAKPIHLDMKRRASTDPKWRTGALYRSLVVYPVSGQGEFRKIRIGVNYKKERAYYANPVEYGHGGPAPAPPHPFVRPAYDAKADEAYSQIAAVLIEALSKL